MAHNDLIKNYLDHFSQKYSKKIEAYAESIFPNYIFTRREKSQQFAYCTACKTEFKTDDLAHKADIKCPNCNERVYVQSSGMGRSKMVNEAYFIYYEKSVIDPEVIVARGIHAAEDYRGQNYKNVKPVMIDRTLYVFKIGESVILKRYTYYSWHESKMNPGGCHWGSHSNFDIARTVHSELGSWAQRNWSRGLACFSRESISAAVAKTQFKYSTWEQYQDEPMVKFFDLYCRYPKAVEYLTKLGFVSFVDAKLTESCTCGAINWKGKTVFEILRVNRLELKQLRTSGIIITPLFLKLFQINKKDKNGYSMKDIKIVEREFGTNQVKEIYAITKHTSLKKAFNYIKGQCNSCKSSDGKSHFRSFYETLITYRDYINDCKALELDFKQESVLFPKNLHNAHQNTITQVKFKENEKFNAKIAKRVTDLEKRYYFEYAGLFIRPPKDSKEIIEEGKKLQHCVGTYAERHANGNTNILFIRKASEPENSYYTMEVNNNNSIIQTRGLKNCSSNKEIEKFIKAFTAEKLEKKNKVKISVPA